RRLRSGLVRIAGEVAVFEDHVPRGHRVVAAEPVPPVVARLAVLRLAGGQLDFARIGLDPEVATANVHRLAACDRLDDPAAIAVGAVDPVVEPPDKTVEAMLLIPLDKPGEEHLLHVRLAVAIRVLGVKDVRGTRDEYALAPRQDAGRIADVVEEHG